MKDIYFKNYNSEENKNIGQDDIRDRITQQKYEQIIRNQKNNAEYFEEFEPDDEENNQNFQKSKPTKKKKKGCGCGCSTFLLIIILIVALVFGGCFAGLYSVCSKTNYIGKSDFEVTDLIKKNDSVYNVLLIGADKDQNGTSRSDSMILVTIDREHQMLKFTSFMRDTWVEIPDNGEAKLNAAYAYGGAELLIETIEKNFRIDIDNFVMVDFEMFKKLIDAMGGVTVEITEDEAEFINRTSHAKVTSGENTLNGDYALIYCRIRKLDSDFMRTQRQRKVMTALFRQVVRENPFKTFKGMTDVLPLITTDISPLRMTIKAFSALSLLKYSNDDMRIPVDGTYDCRMMYGQDSLVPDLEENQEALESFIYGE